MNIIKNEAIDLIFAFNRFGLRNKNINPDFPRLEILDEWCVKYEKELSPFLLNDISLLSEKTYIITLYLFEKVHYSENVNSVEDFLSMLNNLSVESLKKDIVFFALHNMKLKLTVENIYKQLANDGLHPGYDLGEEALLIYGLLNEPENFIYRLKTTYYEFNKQVFSKSKNELDKIIQEKYLWHFNQLKNNKNKYIKALGLSSIVQQSSNYAKIQLYFSLFADNDVSTIWDSQVIIIGGATDKRLILQSRKKQSDLFFSCLGDPKRLEILRLTSKRAWYSSELARYFNLKAATLSYHINKLVEADLLKIKKGGSKRFYYTLNRKSFSDFLSCVSQDMLGNNDKQKK